MVVQQELTKAQSLTGVFIYDDIQDRNIRA